MHTSCVDGSLGKVFSNGYYLLEYHCLLFIDLFIEITTQLKYDRYVIVFTDLVECRYVIDNEAFL